MVLSAAIAWGTTRSTRARRRAEEAHLALKLLEAAESSTAVSLRRDAELSARLSDSARFATVEFTRLMLADGPRYWTILPVLAYGVMLLVASAFTDVPNAVSVFTWIAVLCFVYAGSAFWVKRVRSKRLVAAGVHVPTARELLENEFSDWKRVFAERRARRNGARAAGQDDVLNSTE